MAASSQGPAAIEFAARHPERLIGLVLCNAMAKVEGSWLDAPIRTLAAMSEVEKDAGVAVPVNAPVPVLKLAHEGMFVIE